MEEKTIIDPEKIILEQIKLLHEESKKEQTTAIEKIGLSQAMAALHKVIME